MVWVFSWLSDNNFSYNSLYQKQENYSMFIDFVKSINSTMKYLMLKNIATLSISFVFDVWCKFIAGNKLPFSQYAMHIKWTLWSHDDEVL